MKLGLLGASFALMLVALPLISWGAWQEQRPLWITGLGLVGVAAVLPPATRFLDESKDAEQKPTHEKDAQGDAARTPERESSHAARARAEAARDGQGTSAAGVPRRGSERARLQQRKADQAMEGQRKRE